MVYAFVGQVMIKSHPRMECTTNNLQWEKPMKRGKLSLARALRCLLLGTRCRRGVCHAIFYGITCDVREGRK